MHTSTAPTYRGYRFPREIIAHCVAAMHIKNGVDSLAVEGMADTRYNIPNFHVSAHHPTVNVPILAWRSVGYTPNAFVVEALIDELATRAKIDAIAYRLKLLNPGARKLRTSIACCRSSPSS